MAKKLTLEEIDGFVSVVNSLIERYCEKYPDEYDFDDLSIGFTQSGQIFCVNGDDIADTLDWVNSEIIPDLCK